MKRLWKKLGNYSFKAKLMMVLTFVLILFFTIEVVNQITLQNTLEASIKSYGASKMTEYLKQLEISTFAISYYAAVQVDNLRVHPDKVSGDDVEIEIGTLEEAILGYAGEAVATSDLNGTGANLESKWKEIRPNVKKIVEMINTKVSAEDLQKAVDQMNSNFQSLKEEIKQPLGILNKQFNSTYKIAYNMKRYNTWISAVSVFLLLIFITSFVLFVIRISSRLGKTALNIDKDADQVAQLSLQVKDTSQKVSSAATQQASAIQETVSTLNEITAMVNKSVENANMSREKAASSHQVATSGKKVVSEMIVAMNAIDESNNNIMEQINESNQKISDIVKVITQISNKTNVINDIVFQTKLLSFNASVEAARAGEHGKGFAVVAEEVGGLAQMSGNAAKEIGEMLNDSIEKVESIVNETKEQVESLIKTGSSKVESGMAIAKRCDEVLEEIVKNVGEVRLMMEEVATASNEQAEGINNISTAMNELDEVTHANSNTAHATSELSLKLTGQAESLKESVLSLSVEVHGETSVLRSEANSEKSSLRDISSSQHNNMIKLQTKKKVEKNKAPTPKKVVGSDASFPTEDDSRFEEV